jgi:hypothetical protein
MADYICPKAVGDDAYFWPVWKFAQKVVEERVKLLDLTPPSERIENPETKLTIVPRTVQKALSICGPC